MSGESPPYDVPARLERVASIVDQLACPACFAGLRLDARRIACMGCGRVYPLIDGIPVLIAEAAESDCGRP